MMPKDVLDEHIARIADGDKSALAAFYQHVRTAVYSYALSLLKNRADAEDVLHDTILEVWRSAAKYESMGKPMAWVMTITRNLCFKILAKRSRVTDEPPDELILPDDAGMTDEDRVVLLACMDELADDEREIVIMHAISGLKHREIAAILKQPLSTVISRYNRAIKKLRVKLSEEGGERRGK